VRGADAGGAGVNDYTTFLEKKTHVGLDHGFDPIWMPDILFPFQKSLVEWSCRKGRAAVFADCGLGKTFIQLTWAENVARKTSGRVLILTPLAVSFQTVTEGKKIGVDVQHRREGSAKSDRIVVTNYERLHYFNPDDFDGVVCDESSILKHFSGATQMAVTRFMTKIKYRLLCTATAAPNDYIELGTSSEVLGQLSHSEMLTRFFKQLDDKGQKKELREQGRNIKLQQHFAKLSFRVHQSIGQWRLKKHAEVDFWKWVCSWARACRKPSDLGFDDSGFILPPLIERNHVIHPTTPPDGMLFTLPAIGLREERDERRRTLTQRCEFVADLVKHDRPAVVWCHMNDEGNKLAGMIPDARQIAGCTPDDEKEEIYRDFATGNLRVLVIKPKIGAWGLNWQHCNHVVTFASHSYEQFYQSVRRCWRFGQKNPVNLDVIATVGESGVIANMLRKSDQADKMFSVMVECMNQAQGINRINKHTNEMELPSWL
jgi:superfamily II DNA or RNA helicase